jgi:hypothetical protein
VCNSDENTAVSDERPWERVAQMARDTFRKLSTGASWSGHERNHLFMGGLEGHQFMRASGLSGLDDPGDSRAFATIDYDRDGWLDVVLGNVSAPRLRLLRNELGDRAPLAQNRFLALRFRGGNTAPTASSEWSSRDGLGVRVVLRLDDGRAIHREHRVDDGFKAQNSATMLVGIGGAEEIASLSVHWPSGRAQEVEGLEPGSLVTLYEDVSASPSGSAAVSEPYRTASPAVAEAAARRRTEWPTRLFPSEPSGQRLSLGALEGLDSTLVLHLGVATWCVACAKEIPELRDIATAFDASELTMVGVPCDPKEGPDELAAWTRKLSPPYRIAEVSDEERDAMFGVSQALLHQSGPLPFSVVTDGEGEVLLASWGVPTISELRRFLWLEEARVVER